MKNSSGLSFAVDRSKPIKLVDQLVEGFRNAILCGIYPAGSLLPRLRDVEKACGVSLIIVRMAYKRLSDEGLVRSREHVGTVVLGGDDQRWRGRVLMVFGEAYSNYYFGNLSAIVAKELLEARYLVVRVYVVPDASGRPDYSMMDAALDSSLSLIISCTSEAGIVSRARKHGIPLVMIERHCPRGCPPDGFIRWNSMAAIPDFVDWCRRNGVRRVVEVCMKNGERYAFAGAALRRAGIRTVRWAVPRIKEGFGVLERIHLATQRLFFRRLSRKRVGLPDVFYTNEDHIAAAALQALDGLGIRVPEDVRFVSWSNRGNGPFYRNPIGLIEMDPYAHGEQVSGWVLNRLRGHRTGRLSLDSRFRP